MDQPSPQRSLPYMPQLDGLRAVAVGLVMAGHYLPSYLAVKTMAPWGTAGVHLFFVLSGFLIVGILLRERRACEEDGRGRTILRFYLRRALRILPVFVLAMVVGLSLGLPGFRPYWAWHLTYATNLLPLRGAFDLEATTHFWSLAVEEQFYTIIPWVMLLLPARWLKWALATAILTAPVVRVLSLFCGDNSRAAVWNSVGCFDALSLGALLAMARDPVTGALRGRDMLARLGLWIGVPFSLLTMPTALRVTMHPVIQGMTPLFWAMACTWLIDRAAVGFAGPVGRFLGSRPMVAIGRVSYGLYVYHMLIPWILDAAYEGMGWQVIDPGWHLIGLWVILSFAAATLSWRFYEMPINNLRRLLDKSPRLARPVVPVVAVAG